MIKFGPAGNSGSFYAEGNKHTVEMPKWLNGRGLDCFEYSLGKGILIKEETAAAIGAAASEFGIEMSVHAPYFINFAREESYEKSEGYILESLKVLKAFGGNRLVFHVGSPVKQAREDAVRIACEALLRLADAVKGTGLYDGIRLCPETMGKIGQIGSVDEIIKLSALDPIYTPCIDFGHVNAREQGLLKDADAYLGIVERFLDVIGERARTMHVHFSRIEYSTGGEVRHLTFSDDRYGPYFEDFAPVIRRTGLEPYIICESDGTQAEDAAEMKRLYLSNR
ncbi:MAG: TIM barrel protein [Clostridiales bacterium]|jgi:deoxyribonuclease-4|nr:TIM barrel protein [Clostridiales bacterium]